MHWAYLLLAIVFEVMGTLSIKQASTGNTYLWSSLIAIFYGLSFWFIFLAIKKIDIGTAYAIWAGLGTVLIVFFGWLIFKENMNLSKVIGVLFIVFGVIILKLQSNF